MSTPQMRPYTPALYLPGNLGRYRSYPRRVTTPIPGAGYRAKKLVWREQELNLDGGGGGQRYGSPYDEVPLRGIGGYHRSLGQDATVSPAPTLSPVARFFEVGSALFGGNPASITNREALVEYAKVAAVGMFVGVPVAALAGYMLRGRLRANRRRRARR